MSVVRKVQTDVYPPPRDIEGCLVVFRVLLLVLGTALGFSDAPLVYSGPGQQTCDLARVEDLLRPFLGVDDVLMALQQVVHENGVVPVIVELFERLHVHDHSLQPLANNVFQIINCRWHDNVTRTIERSFEFCG
ncbi:MAG: hypothetical protein IKG94_07345 [Candidatus Methanomethylophilaceae archaeon]|nr:hypothetical protein [Candidatus Methanomethylophilaceae archaeon]MBR6205196.1 hypothetical protein [Candidatus Methanomethylophilaceae archaeon]